MLISWVLAYNAPAESFRGREVQLVGYNDTSYHNPGMYNTTTKRDMTARRIIDQFSEPLAIRDYLMSTNCCFSDHETGIKSRARVFDFLSLGFNIATWYSNYVPTRTSPYRHPRDVMYGIPNNIPDWYKSIHDSTESRCINLIQSRESLPTELAQAAIPNYEDRRDHALRNVPDDRLEALSKNHCFKCFHRVSQSGCNGFRYIMGLNIYPDESTYIALATAQSTVEEAVTEACNPTPEAVQIIANAENRTQQWNTVPEIEFCEHGLNGPPNCMDCDNTVLQMLTAEAAEATEEPEVNQGEAVVEETTEETVDVDLAERMRLVNAWAQAERD